MSKTIIKRKILSELRSHLKNEEMALILGPRQAGKTTLMKLLLDELNKKSEKTLFLDYDNETDRQFFKSQQTFLEKIKLEFGNAKGFIFIDEIQRKEDAGLFLKGIYDLNLPHKFIISGSGSMELKEKIHESLAGRKRVFELSTVSIEEFINFKTDYQYQDTLDAFLSLDLITGEALLKEYLAFGGYPKVILADNILEKRKLIDEIYQSFLIKDISFLLKVKKTTAFSNLLKIISSQVGQLVNYSELASTLDISSKTVKEYLWYLEKTYIIQKVTPFVSNTRKEITKSPLFYFYDLGLRNYALGAFELEIFSKIQSFNFENLVLNLLKEKIEYTGKSIHFWRTKSGAEVDFIINSKPNPIPIEVKYSKLKEPKITKSFRSFLKKFEPKSAYVVNLSLRKKVKINNTSLFFITFQDLIKESKF